MSGVRTELVTALERGMVVFQSFSQVSTPMTLSEADDQSLSLAIPVFGPTGTVVAALEWSGVADADAAAARKQHLPVLQQASHRIETMLVEVPDLVASLTGR